MVKFSYARTYSTVTTLSTETLKVFLTSFVFLAFPICGLILLKKLPKITPFLFLF